MYRSFLALAQVNMASVGAAPQTPRHRARAPACATAVTDLLSTTTGASPRPLPSDRLSPARRQIGQFAAALRYAAWNCSASVEPDRATVSAFGEIAEVTRSKYPVPTSRWWRVAV